MLQTNWRNLWESDWKELPRTVNMVVSKLVGSWDSLYLYFKSLRKKAIYFMSEWNTRCLKNFQLQCHKLEVCLGLWNPQALCLKSLSAKNLCFFNPMWQQSIIIFCMCRKMNKVGKPWKLKHSDFLNSSFRKGRDSNYSPKHGVGNANSW